MSAGRSMNNAFSSPTISVLMSTYAKEKACNLKASLESLFQQTRRPDQIVLVVDGPVDGEQEDVIACYREDKRVPLFTLIRHETSQGLAEAMNSGLGSCIGTFILRMDSDDLCDADRIQVQLAYAEAHPGTDVISSWSEEFFEDGSPSRMKVSPVSHDAVVSALRWRNVIVHPTLFIKAEWLRRVGGYRAKYGMLEDYDLFVRLALSGARFHVIPKVLVRVRASAALHNRRGGLRYCLKEMRFRLDCLASGFLNFGQFLVVAPMYAAFRLVSGPMRRHLYVLART
ncbi:glycosyltransferase [Microvirga flavescens]|uniref:glycosyltransferase n=1 Tax=Microvirga flavescens TaxID=2249811 RepID=UPI001FE15C8C|nr:glycosyltransferase [Microvirga flavescens]